MIEIYIGLGSNMGNKEENIRKAIECIKEKCKILKTSSLYETEPVGYEQQDWFFNGVIKAETELEAQPLLKFLQEIEEKLGRVRKIKDGPRIIDLDLLLYGDQIITDENLIVPHPRMQERGFVLIPLNEIEPNFVHPILQKTIQILLSELPKEKEVRKISRWMLLQ